MREMKDSGIEWMGSIPEEWNTEKIKHHFTIGSGTTPKSDIPEYWDGDIVWITPADFKTDDIYVGEGHRNITRKGFDESSLDLVPSGSIIFSKRAPIGQVVINSRELCTNQGCLTGKIKDDSDVRYYRYVMSIATEEFELSGSGTTFKEISASSFANTLLPSPTPKEQRRISDYLDRKCSQIDSIIAKQEQIIEKLKEYKLSVITEAVTKGLASNVEMKDSGVEWIGKIPHKWTVSKIKNYCELKTGCTPSTANSEWFDGDVNWFTPGDFNENYYLYSASRTLSQKAKDDNVAVIIPANTVMLVGIGATAGKIGFAREECSCNQQITALKTNTIDSHYLMFWMIANTRFLRETAMFTTLPILNNSTIGEYLLVLPNDIVEQKEIAIFLTHMSEQVENRIRHIEMIVSKLKEYKKSLIYEVVTGKKEV